MANIPVNKKLWAKCQSEAKRKYRVHPSAYSNGYASKIYGEKGGKWRSDSNEERLSARRINTRLRMDDWKRIGPNQRGQKCDEGRGWIGLKGSCKRSKKSLTTEQKTKLRKESAVGLADKIRAKKGMRDRNVPKIKKKPHELSSWEWAKANRPEAVARLEAGWESQGTRRGITELSGRLTDEHKALVKKALAKGEKVQKSILSEHQIRTSSESWRSEKGRIALSMDRTIVVFKDDQSMSLKAKPKPDEIAKILIENSKREVDVKFRSRSDRDTKSFMKRIESIADLAGYSVTPPSGRVEQGHNFPEQYVVTMHSKRSGANSTNRSDSLKTWFAEDWKAINSSGKIVGECGGGETKGKVKCLPASKARLLSKKDRSTLAKRKQSQDPNPNREGMPVMVSSKTDAMDPATLARAIVSIERKYELRLDARSVWLRMDAFKKVKELAGGKCDESNGWYGLKGGCKRGKKGDGDARIKESKVEIAGRIRKRKMKTASNKNKEIVKTGPMAGLKNKEQQSIVKKQAAETPKEIISNALKNTDGLSPELSKQIKVEVDRAKYGAGNNKKAAFAGSPSHPEFGGNSRIFMARDAVSDPKANYDNLDTLNHLQQMSAFSNPSESTPKTETEFYSKQANFDLAKVWSGTSSARKEELAKEHGTKAISSSNKLVKVISQELSDIRIRQENDEEKERIEKKIAREKAAENKPKVKNKDLFDDLFS